MAIADDVAEVMQELGTALTIHNSDGTTTTGEFVDFETYPDHSTLFTRMYIYSGTMASTSVIEKGNVVSFGNLFFIVTNKIGSYFENALIENTVIFYRCNVIGNFKRYNDNPRYDDNYEREAEWELITSDVHGCLVEKKLTTELEDHLDVASISNETNVLYVSAANQIKIGDRWELTADERYRIDSVSKFEIDNVLVCQVSKDDRG